MIRRIIPYFSKYKKYPVYAFLAIFVEVVCEVMQPVLMTRIIDEGIPNRDIALITRQGLLMCGLALVSLTAGICGAKFAAKASTGVASELRYAEMEKIQQLSFHNMDYFSNASLITRLSSDVTNIQNTGVMSLRILSRAPLMLMMAVFFAININAELSLVFLVAVPVLALVLALIVQTAFPRFHKMQQATDRLNRTLQENFIGVRVVKSFVREQLEKDKFNQENTNFRERALHAMNVVIFNMPMMQLTIYGCMLAVMWFGGRFVMNGVMMTGELISFISYITQIMMSLMMLSFVFVMLTMTKASAERIFEVIDVDIDVKEAPDAQPVDAISGDVAFENVHFSYGKDQSEEVLSNISFYVRSGQVLGIIGATGSGKTSLVQLIPRLYDTTKGTVYVGGRDVKTYRFEDLRQHVSMVLQKNTLFTGTIRDNLRWGNENATDEELIQAAKYAQAHDFIMSFPEGYDTKIEQGGNNLSGGQKQRLCIARAMVRKPAVLILDDSTSAVDTATDSAIRDAFFNHLPNTTVIIIAQRISSIQGADQILVLDDGKINGIGTHETLMTDNAIYRSIYETQTKGADA
ncbi:MAG: ABC transporter ATP-binding protein [Aerococcaceae bacterium]|nr:ABC transporter ATP-binding protein [Aerococcaceae bacterium]